ncbi:S9 family peptidase [candidate division KSB1 bacterium]|nr:S9 family peptidase [candidate division KSB1 bacterium]
MLRYFLYLIFILSIHNAIKPQSNDTLIKAEDLYQLNEISNLAISPDGKHLAYIIHSIDKEKNSYYSHIWINCLATGKTFRLSGDETGQNISPNWSGDSQFIIFISNRSGFTRLWCAPVNGGEAYPLTNFMEGICYPRWSPDNKKILFLSQIKSKSGINPLVENGERLIDYKGREFAKDAKVIKKAFYRTNKQYIDDSYFQLFTITPPGREPRQLTYGSFNKTGPDWSPDSRQIVFCSQRNSTSAYNVNDWQLCVANLNDQKMEILASNSNIEREPVWSPDGRKIAYIANSRSNHFSAQTALWTISPRGENRINLTRNLDRSVTTPKWSPDNRYLFFLVKDRGNQHIYRTKVSNSHPELICGGERQIKEFCLAPSLDKIYFIASDNLNPADLYVYNLRNKQEKQLTHINQQFLSHKSLSCPETFWYSSFDSLRIQGWLMKPVSFQEGEKYPLIIEIHGGPYINYSNEWNLEFQFLAGAGYGVFYCNPRGSTSYSQFFANQNHGRWGEGDFQDILAGTQYLMKTGWIDSLRLGITGGSYGGYLTNWAISQVDIFKAAVTQRSISSLFSFYGTTDIPDLLEYEFGMPWHDADEYFRRSPIKYVQNIRTPLLILHADLDYRVPISQAEELFLHLKRLGRTVEFIRYPDEGHDLPWSGQPIHQVDRLNRLITWFEKYIK